MNVKAQPIMNRGIVTPRSIGYSYLNGSALATATPPSTISTFGTPHSPTSGTLQPIGPQPILNGVVSRIGAALFGGKS